MSRDLQVLLTTLSTLAGNYGFYPLLTLTLCLSLVDDAWLHGWTSAATHYKRNVTAHLEL